MKVLKDELPDLDNKALFSEMAKRWKKVKKTSEFTNYQNEAEKDKERYLKEKGDMDINKSLGPKKPSTVYMIFCKEERKKIDHLKGKELMIELGVRWQNLKNNIDSSLLEKYQKLAEEEKEQYKIDKEKYKTNQENDKLSEVINEDESINEHSSSVIIEEEKSKKKQSKKKEIVEEKVEEKKIVKAKKPVKK
jgi:hypothetical protein